MRGDGNNRQPGPVAVEQSIDKMEVAGTAASGTDRKRAGDMRIGAGRERGDFLMAHMQPLNAAMPAQRIGEAVQAVPNDAVDPAHAGRRKRFHHLVGNGFCHVCSPQATHTEES